MGINLGFENLGMAPKASGELSYEYLDSLIQFNQAASDVLDLCHELTAVVRTYDNVNAISRCIKKYGVTRSLEALYGENFSSAASMEAENEEAKKGLGQKIKAIIESLLKRLGDFWKWMTDSGERAARALDKLAYTKDFDWTDENGNRYTVNKDKFGSLKQGFKTKLEAARKAVTEAKDYLNKIKSDTAINQELVDSAKKKVEDAVKNAKQCISAVNRFIGAAKKGSVQNGPKTPGEDPERDDTDYGMNDRSGETDKRQTR